ncbi:hypothetical protein [Citricoccus muralis]|uniref:hypothetical protein n=1 Tax=Citricoccus muralis TaxID=169134 RepID=UPI000E27F4B6|nr:hypothetical protein [Citricoccus muralis]
MLDEQGIEAGEIVEHVSGPYLGIELTLNHELATDDWVTGADLPDGWTEEDRAAAATFGLNTIIAGAINNVTNDAEDTPEGIRKPINDMLLTTATDEAEAFFQERIEDHGWAMPVQGTPLLLAEGFRGAGYDGVYDGLTPRVRTVDSEVCNIQPWDGGMFHEMSVDLDLNMAIADGTSTVEPTRMLAQYNVVKDEEGNYGLNTFQYNWALKGGENTAAKMAEELGVEVGDIANLDLGGADSDFYCDWDDSWAL